METEYGPATEPSSATASEASTTSSDLETSSAPSEASLSPLRMRLKNHQARSSTTVHGWPAFFFGIPFLGAGLIVILAALDVIPADDASFHVPRNLVAACGLLFAAPGAALIVHGLCGVWRKKSNAAASASSGGHAWTYEHPWDRSGLRLSGWKRVWMRFSGLLFMALFLTPFHWLLFFTEEDIPLFPKVIIGIFDLFIVAMLIELIKSVLQALRYGTTYVRFDRFPYYTNGKLRIALGFTRDPPQFDRLDATLRAVEEAYETSGTGKNKSQKVVAYAVEQIENSFTEPHEMPTADRDIWLEFDVPRTAPSTNLSARPPTYWELAIHGDAPGVDFEQVFLIPIYAAH